MIDLMPSNRIRLKYGLKLSISLWAILAVHFLSPRIHAQEEQILIESSVDRSIITVGDPITYTLTITRAESVKVDPPEMGVNLGQFEIRDYEVFEPQKTEAGTITESYSYVISIYDTGEFEIPPVTITYTDVKGQERQINSQAITITVNSVKPSEAEDIKGIKPPVEIVGRSTIYLWGAGALLFITCALVFFYLWKRKRARGEIEEEELEPLRPAHEIAYEELERIESLDLIAKGLIKRYYTEASEVIRRYVGHRYRIITMELTTAELVDSMIEEEIEKEHITAIQSFLEESDLVKFAKYHPSQEVMYELIPRARAIVDALRETLIIPFEEKTERADEREVERTEAEPVETGRKP